MKRLLKYVEITTKITSTLPFILTLGYLYFTGTRIDPLKSAVFFAGMFLFDLTATAVNNYEDTKTNHQTLQFSRRVSFLIIVLLFLASVALGVFLVSLTDAAVLVLGMLCFGFGILYSWGPVPISRQPYGELFSGLFYGLLIPFILLYINRPEGTYFTYAWDLSAKSLTFHLELIPLLKVALFAVLPACLTANIMLANNICDLEKDILVKRYTLPYYIGKKALRLYAVLYYAAYASIVVMVLLKMVPALCLLTLLTFVPVQRNINIFMKRQEKSETFILSVKNFIMIISAQIAFVFIGALIGRL